MKPAESGELPPTEELYVPDRYNSRSTLTAAVTTAGPNTFDFELVGDPPRK